MKSFKQITFFTFVPFLVLLLSGCQSNEDSSGIFQQYLVEPFTQAIHGIASVLGDSYGLAIVLITLIIRLILMPFMLKQYKKQRDMKEKMDVLKPEMDEIQTKLKNTQDKEEQMKLQQEMFGLYRKHGVNPLAMGCLPLILQMPILMGFYYAIRDSHEIATHSFLWFNLGAPDLFITALAGLVYYLQFKVTQANMPATQQQQMKMMGLLSPIMIVIFSFSAPAALPLYWTVGGIFLIIQSIIGRKMYPAKTLEPAESKNN